MPFRVREQRTMTSSPRFLLWHPPGLDASKRWPVIFYFAPESELRAALASTASDGLLDILARPGGPAHSERARSSALASASVVVCAPFLSSLPAAPAAVEDAIADATAELPANAEKVYVVGRGEGAARAWELASNCPWRFAGLAVWDLPAAEDWEAGAPVQIQGAKGTKTTPRTRLDEQCEALRRMPVWVYSSSDPPPLSDPQLGQADPPKPARKLKVTVGPPKASPPAPKPPPEPELPPPFADTLRELIAAKLPPPAAGSELAFGGLRAAGSVKVLRTMVGGKDDGRPRIAGAPFEKFDFWRWLLGHSRPRGPGRM
ncbi:hypothetical protein DFJ74DRAFT_767850 [Hyaloraphidium curvatum]|nr:hypothetical protein DFJ74DRAFT_767850 [Hyaloraphidium curvatum]